MKTSVSITRRKQQKTLVSRKSRRLRRKFSLRREYKKLRSLLPRTIKSPDLRHKVGVVDAAYQYIRHLQSALLDKFSSRGIPPDLAAVVGDKVSSPEDVQTLALYLIRQNTTSNNRNNPLLKNLSNPSNKIHSNSNNCGSNNNSNINNNYNNNNRNNISTNNSSDNSESGDTGCFNSTNPLDGNANSN